MARDSIWSISCADIFSRLNRCFIAKFRQFFAIQKGFFEFLPRLHNVSNLTVATAGSLVFRTVLRGDPPNATDSPIAAKLVCPLSAKMEFGFRTGFPPSTRDRVRSR